MRGQRGGLLIHGVLKLAGEAGELADLVGKWWGQGHELDREKLIAELGDVLWHVAEVSTALGVDLQEVAYLNLSKLQTRYPEGFDPEHSLNRSEQHSTFIETMEARNEED
jgi:NTP pyrophosphatase (non-canonical NTP hydrolase)